MKHTFYLDYGAGKVLIEPKSRQLKLSWILEFNPCIKRKKLSGTFILTESQATAAFSHFITNGNETALIYIYEYGTDITGTLIYEGQAKILGEFDFNANTITFNDFITVDLYKAFEESLNIKKIAISTEDAGISLQQLTIQGVNPSCNKIKTYEWVTNQWVASGNAYDLNIVGNVCGCSTNFKELVIYDTHSRSIRKFVFGTTDYTPDTDGTLLELDDYTGNGALMSYTSGKILFVDDYWNRLSTYEETTGTWTLLDETQIHNIKNPSICELGSGYAAIVDDETKTLRTIVLSGDSPNLFGYEIEIGEVSRPKICQIDQATNTIALVDEKTLQLKVFTFDVSTKEWSQVGNTYIIDTVVNPSLASDATNVLNILDPYSGKLKKYTFDGTDWTITGLETIAGAGIFSMVVYISTAISVINSDSYSYNTGGRKRAWSIAGTINSILFDLIYYKIRAVNDASFDIDNIYIVKMSQLAEINSSDTDIETTYLEFTAQELLKLCELFNNYYYIVEGTGTGIDLYDIMFTQPEHFSSFGTDINVSSYLANNNRRVYNEKFNISKEEIIFANEFNSDFKGEIIEYGRDNSIILSTPYNFTTDLGELVKNSIGLNNEFKKEGNMLAYIEADANDKQYCTAGTGISTETNVKNYKLSKTQIYNDFWKDFRYKNDGTIKINGVDVPVQSTVRDIIEFPEIEIKLDNFPDLPASLDWGSGIKSFITNLSYDFQTNKTTIQSVQLDL